MQTNNIQLGLVVKPTASSSSNGPSSGLLAPADSAGDFGNWMQSAAKPAAANNRSDSKTLPQDGSDLPASKPPVKNETAAAKERSSSSEGSASVSQSEVASGSEPKPAETRKNEASVTQSPSNESAGAEATVAQGEESADTSANPQTEGQGETQLNGQEQVATETVDQVEQEIVDVEGSGIEAAENADVEAVGVVVSEQVNTNADDAVQLAANLSQESTETDSQAPNTQARPDQSQAGGRVSSATPPPVIVQASSQGIANGRPFQTQTVDAQGVDRPLVGDVEPAAVAEARLEPSQTAGPVVETAADTSEATAITPVPASVDGELVTPELTAEQLAASSANAEPGDELVQASRTPSQSEMIAQTGPDAELEAVEITEQASAVVSSAEAEGLNAADVAETVTVAPAVSDARVAEIRAAQTTAQPAGPINANQSVAADSASAGTGQQAGADSQMGRQRSADQLAQAAAKAGSDSPAKAEGQTSSNNAATPNTAATATAASGAPTETVARPQASVATAVPPQALNRMQQEQWGQRLGERTLMMAQQGPRVAYLQLDPPELGALQVRVHLTQGDQVSLSFSSPNAAVRDVLEQHLPRLREMFAEQGLNLAQSDVRDQSAGGRDRGESDSQRGEGRYVDGPDEVDLPFMEMQVPVGRVDYYA